MATGTPQTFLFTIDLLIQLTALAITAVSAFYTYRRGGGVKRHMVKDLLLIVQVLFAGVVVTGLLRDLSGTRAFAVYFIDVSTSFILWDAVLLTVIALSIYFRPGKPGPRSLLREVLSHRVHAVLFFVFAGYVAFVDIYLLAAAPYNLREVTNFTGVSVVDAVLTTRYLDLLLAVLVVFMVYPALLMFLEARRTGEAQARRAMRFLAVAWVGIGAELLIFNGYLLNLGIEATAIGYLLATGPFSVTAAIFGRTTLIEGFFEPLPLEPRNTLPEKPSPSKISLGTEKLAHKNVLLEVDPAVNYEQVVKDIAVELTAANYRVFAFTSRSRPVFTALSAVPGIRLFVFTTKVSYPKPSEQSNEVLVPQTDQGVLLNVLDKTITSNPGAPILIIFDSISDMILSGGFDNSYKFLKQANEMINDSGATAIFLLTMGAHEDRILNIVRSLFTNHMTYQESGLKITRDG